MEEFRYVFGPVPSRRLGNSLGVSPIPQKTCNYSCTYCQLGRTDRMSNRRELFFSVDDILSEFEKYLEDEDKFDVVTIVGEGEPTLYAGLGELISRIKERTNKPVAVITNGALLSDPQVRKDLAGADLVLPSMDAADEKAFRSIDRPIGSLRFDEVMKGLEVFTHEFTGQIWVEIMLLAGENDDDESLERFRQSLQKVRYDRLYINTPVRPPAESQVSAPSEERVGRAVELLEGISIDMLSAGSFFSEVEDDYEAVISIIGRHPMNQFEVKSFLESREHGAEAEAALERLSQDPKVEVVHYKGITTFRLK